MANIKPSIYYNVVPSGINDGADLTAGLLILDQENRPTEIKEDRLSLLVRVPTARNPIELQIYDVLQAKRLNLRLYSNKSQSGEGRTVKSCAATPGSNATAPQNGQES